MILKLYLKQQYTLYFFLGHKDLLGPTKFRRFEFAAASTNSRKSRSRRTIDFTESKPRTQTMLTIAWISLSKEAAAVCCNSMQGLFFFSRFLRKYRCAMFLRGTYCEHLSDLELRSICEVFLSARFPRGRNHRYDKPIFHQRENEL